MSLFRALETAHEFLTFRDLVRCRVSFGRGCISDSIYRMRLHTQVCEVIQSSRVRYGTCVVHGCDMERLLYLTVDDGGVRKLSWYPYCGMHKRIHHPQ